MQDVLDAIARSLMSQLARDEAVAAVLVTYTDADVKVSCDAADALRRAIAPMVPRTDTWAVSRGRYFAPGCADASCCPAEGTVLPFTDAMGRELPIVGWRSAVIHGSRTDAWGGASATARRRCSRAADRWLDKRTDGLERWRRDSSELWQNRIEEGGLGPVVLREADMGRLIAGLTDVRVRDAVIVSLIPDSAMAIDDVLGGISSVRVARALDSVLDPRQGVACDPVQAAALRNVLTQCVTHCRRKEAAPVLTLHALVEWWVGAPMAALSLCDAAEASTPGYRLAALVRATILSGVVPGWQA